MEVLESLTLPTYDIALSANEELLISVGPMLDERKQNITLHNVGGNSSSSTNDGQEKKKSKGLSTLLLGAKPNQMVQVGAEHT